jgi:hypothetical protein
MVRSVVCLVVGAVMVWQGLSYPGESPTLIAFGAGLMAMPFALAQPRREPESHLDPEALEAAWEEIRQVERSVGLDVDTWDRSAP